MYAIRSYYALQSQPGRNLGQGDVPGLIDPAQNLERMSLGPVGVPVTADGILV